jgi:hypothetical protein
MTLDYASGIRVDFDPNPNASNGSDGKTVSVGRYPPLLIFCPDEYCDLVEAAIVRWLSRSEGGLILPSSTDSLFLIDEKGHAVNKFT